jgi:hypothetical protein
MFLKGYADGREATWHRRVDRLLQMIDAPTRALRTSAPMAEV